MGRRCELGQPHDLTGVSAERLIEIGYETALHVMIAERAG